MEFIQITRDISYHTLAQTAEGGGLMAFLPIILMFVVLYFLMIRPQMKRQKEHRQMVENLKVGDEVVTAGGFVGKITRLSDSGYITLQIADVDGKAVDVIIQRPAVNAVLPRDTIKSL